jgi:hypothetical protein
MNKDEALQLTQAQADLTPPQTDKVAPPLNEEARFDDDTIEFALSPNTSASVSIRTRDSKGWTLRELKRLLALLELQRSFLADEPLEVSVSVSSPRPVQINEAKSVQSLP